MLIIIILAILSLIWLLGIVYMLRPNKYLGWLFHDILKWHAPDHKRYFDGCSHHSVCRFCGKEIMQDSQGNWFTFDF